MERRMTIIIKHSNRNKMEQTAVEWLIKQLGENQLNGLYVIDTLEDVKNVFEKAKEMEKQQIFDTWDNGFDNGNYYGKYNENCEINCGEQYYNETYKSE